MKRLALGSLLLASFVLAAPTVSASKGAGAARAAAASKAVFRGLGNLDPTAKPAGSFATGLSGDGRIVVGTSYFFDGNSTQTRAFLWTPKGGMRNLGLPPNTLASSAASGVSNDGSIVSGAVGFTINGNLEIRNGAIWTDAASAAPQATVLPAGLSSNDVSGDGHAVVGATRVPGPWPVIDQGFVIRDAGVYTKFGTLPEGSYSWGEAASANGSVIAGYADTVAAISAVRWTAANGLEQLTGQQFGVPSQANGISADGQVIVGYVNAEAFKWTDTTLFTMLGSMPGALTASALDCSGDGSVIVGTAFLDGGRSAAVLWDTPSVMRTVKEVVENDYGIDLTGWELQSTTAVSDDGRTMIGWGINPSGELEGWIFRRPGTSGPAKHPHR